MSIPGDFQQRVDTLHLTNPVAGLKVILTNSLGSVDQVETRRVPLPEGVADLVPEVMKEVGRRSCRLPAASLTAHTTRGAQS